MDVVVHLVDGDGEYIGQPLHSNSGQEEGGFTVAAETYGTYVSLQMRRFGAKVYLTEFLPRTQSFCFDDARKGAEDKIVTFALHIGQGKKAKSHITKNHIVPLQRTVSELAKTLRSLQSQLEIILLRVERHVATQDSIEGRVNWYTLIETIAIVAVAVLHVTYIRRLVNRKQWV